MIIKISIDLIYGDSSTQYMGDSLRDSYFLVIASSEKLLVVMMFGHNAYWIYLLDDNDNW